MLWLGHRMPPHDDAVGRPLPPAVYARTPPCSPYPFPCRIGRSKIPILHRELLSRHLAPRLLLLLVPLMNHRQAAALSGRATTGEAVPTSLLHVHEHCRTQATVRHKPRPKDAIVVHLYGCLSDGWLPPTLVSPPRESPHVHESPRSSSRRPPPPLRPAVGGAPLPSRADVEELLR
jgi:hypothetical protein